MESKGNSSKTIYAAVFFLLAILLLTMILIGTNVFSTEEPLRTRSFSDGFLADDGMVYHIDEINCGSFPTEKGLSQKLPEDLTNTDALCFTSRNANLSVFLDGEEVYAFTAKENMTGMGYGSRSHIVGLCKEDAGKTVTFRYTGVYQGIEGSGIYGVTLSPAMDYISSRINGMNVSVLFSTLTLFFGLVLILIYFAIRGKDVLPFQVLGLGVFAFIMGTWLLVDTNVLQLLTGTLYFWRDLYMVLPFFLACPLMVFVNSMTKQKRRIYVTLSFLLSLGSLAVLFISRFAYGIDMIETFSKVLIVYEVLFLILTVIMLVENNYYCRMLGTKSSFRSFYIGVTILLVCAVGDLVLYYFRPVREDTFGSLTRIAMTLFIVMMLIRFLNWWTRDHREVERDRFINRALQYAVSSDTPENNIRALIRFLGTEFEARRIFIFEDQKNGKFRGTYEWFAEGRESMSLDLMYVPFHGLVDDLYDAFKKNERKLIIENIDDYKSANSAFYNVLSTNHVDNLVLAPLEVNQNLIGVTGVVGAPQKTLEGIAEIINLISYFLAQLILQREEQKRMYYYSYKDALSGAMNHRAYRKFLDQELDTSTAFGYYCCSVTGLEEINKQQGYEAGDRVVIEVAKCLMDVFGEENVYRMNGTDFSVFGFETEELFFENDVDRAKKMILEKEISVRNASLYCMYGTKNLDLVIQRVNANLV